MFQVLISGTRNPLSDTQKEIIRTQILNLINHLIQQDEYKDSTISFIHGDCSGVDLYVDNLIIQLKAQIPQLSLVRVPAQWSLYGKKAGPIRNTQMVEMKPNILLAFPASDSRGTYDTIRKAQQLDIETRITII